MALPKRSNRDRWLITIGASLIIHIASVAFLNLNPWPTIIKVRPAAYTVTLMPISLREPEIQKSSSMPVPKIEIPKPIEKMKPIRKPKQDDIVEKVKKPEKKTEKLTEEKKESLKHLQEALEEIRKKIALDEIQKKMARRERIEERKDVTPPITPPDSSPSRKADLISIYSSIVKAKILEKWTIPENLLKEMVDLETIIVVIIELDGRIQKTWFEKKSGNTVYDQSAMRALKKAEPFLPIPKELSENTLEFEMHFTPDLIR